MDEAAKLYKQAIETDPLLAIAKKMDWDSINSAVIRAYKHAIVKRERLSRMQSA